MQQVACTKSIYLWVKYQIHSYRFLQWREEWWRQNHPKCQRPSGEPKRFHLWELRNKKKRKYIITKFGLFVFFI